MEQIYDLVRVVNTGSEPVVLRGNTTYTIQVGGERIIPFVEAASWFGDPRLADDGRNRFRSEAFRMTQNLWGYTEGMKYPRDLSDAAAGFLGWEDFIPSVECFDMEGNPIFFLIHDPDGERTNGSLPGLVDPSLLDAQSLAKQVQEMAAQMAKLQQMLAERIDFNTQVPVITEAVGPQPVEPSAATIAAAIANDAADIAAAVDLPQPSFDDIVTDDAPRTVKSGGRSK
jgi:hypothetical protein